MLRRALMFVWLLCLAASTTLAFQPPARPEEFVPIDQLPPTDQLPAAPLLIAAYAFVWMAVMLYIWSLWRRLGKVEADMHALRRRTPSGGGPR